MYNDVPQSCNRATLLLPTTEVSPIKDTKKHPLLNVMRDILISRYVYMYTHTHIAFMYPSFSGLGVKWLLRLYFNYYGF